MNLNELNFLCIQELSETPLLHTHINVTLYFHGLLQHCHLACSIETCKIVATTFKLQISTNNLLHIWILFKLKI
jgi:hypothetical protein